jgi:hypothetical protein
MEKTREGNVVTKLMMNYFNADLVIKGPGNNRQSASSGHCPSANN